MFRSRFLVAGTALLGLAALVGVANATPTDPIFRIDVSDGIGSGFLEFTTLDGTFNGPEFEWTLPFAMDITDGGGNVLATLTTGNLFTLGDPVIGMGFSVLAGANSVNVTVTSTLLPVGLVNPTIAATGAGLTVTDGNSNGASITGLGAGGMAYRADYNGLAPGGTNFASLIAGVAAAPNSSNSVSGNFGPTNIPGAVADMSMQYRFSLTARDLGSGTASYLITPEPTSLAMLGLGALLVGRRRR